jgi:hypothetical protein
MLVDEVPFVYMANKIYLQALPDALPASVAEVTIFLNSCRFQQNERKSPLPATTLINLYFNRSCENAPLFKSPETGAVEFEPSHCSARSKCRSLPVRCSRTIPCSHPRQQRPLRG